MGKNRGQKVLARQAAKTQGGRGRDAAGSARFGQGDDRVVLYRGVGLPDEFYTKLVYQETQVVTGSAVTFNTFQSSLFDPNAALGGSQPTFFDQLAAIYGRYQVMAMTAEVEVGIGTGAVPLIISTAWTDELPSATTIDQLAMYRFSRSRMVSGAGAPAVRWTEHMEMNRIHGYTDIKQVNTLQAQISASPADMAFYTVATGPADGATGVARAVRIKMTYHSRFFSLVTPAPS